MSKFGFIGAGEMGGSIIRGFLKIGVLKEDILASVRTEESAQRIQAELGICAYTDNVRVAKEADVLFLAVKPAQMASVLTEIIQGGISPKPLVSMALGWSVENIHAILPHWPVARIMPNTPLALGEGVTLFHFSREMESPCRAQIRALFEKMGKTFEISPDLFDVATALSGSGPAFVYAFIDALAKATAAQGVPLETATQLAVQTVIGAANMVASEKISPAQLVQKVATPGGCTAAGMDILKNSDFEKIIAGTLLATANRAREVGK